MEPMRNCGSRLARFGICRVFVPSRDGLLRKRADVRVALLLKSWLSDAASIFYLTLVMLSKLRGMLGLTE